MKKCVSVFAAIGFGVAVVLFAAWVVFVDPYATSAEKSSYEDILVVLWPTSLMLMAGHGTSPAEDLLVIAMSVAANTLSYALIGAATWGLRVAYKKIRRS